MSSITFSADLDTKLLDEQIKKSNQTVGDWAKGVEKAGNQADQGLSKMTKSFKDAIKEQKDLIKAIEADIKNLQKAYDNATAGTGKQSAFNELRSAKRALAEEQASLIEIQKQQIESNNKEESTIGRLVGGLGKWVVGLVSVGAALKLFKGVMESTETTAHLWETAIAEGKATLDVFMKSIATADFSNFGERLKTAVSSAKQFTADMEIITNLQRADKLKELDLEKEIGELKRKAYEDETTSNEVKLAAMDSIIAKVQEKAALEVDIATKTQWAIADKTTGVNKITEEELTWAITNYKYIAGIGDKYNELQKRLENAKKGNKWGISIGGEMSADELQAEINALGPQAAAVGAIAAKLGEVNSKERETMFAAIAAVKQANNAVYSETQRIWMRRSALKDRMTAEDKDKAKQAEDDAKLENKMAKEFEALNKAVTEGNTAEIKAITDRIIVLQKELDVRTEIAKAAILAAYGGAVKPVTTSNLKSPTLGTLPTMPGIQASPFDLAKIKEEARQRQWNVDEEESLKKQEELRQQILKASSELVYQLGQALGIEGEQAQQLDAMLNAFSQLAAGDAPGAAITMLSTLIQMIPTHAQKFAAEIENINQLIREQQRLVDQSAQKGGGAAALSGLKSANESEKQATLAEITRLEKQQKLLKYANPLGLNFLADLKYNSNKDKLDVLNQKLIDLGYSAEDAQQALDDFFTGTTQNEIANTIMQGFEDGKTSAADFAGTFEDLMRGAINNALEDGLSIDLTAWYAKFKEDMSDGVLTPEEMKELKDWYVQIIADAKANREAMYQVTGIDPTTGTIGSSSNPGLTGIVRNMSEDTGNELTGIIRNQRDDIRQVRDYSKLGVDHLMNVSANTYGSWQELKAANENLKKAVTTLEVISGNTKQVPTGAL